MPMTVIVSRDVVPRFRGFLASCLLEVAPGVYVSPHMNSGVRERVWSVMEDWFEEAGGGSLVLVWREKGLPGGQGIKTLGTPPISLVDLDGVILSRRK